MAGDTEYYLPSTDQLNKLNALRNDAIEPAYESYLESPPTQTSAKLPCLELVHSSDIDLEIRRDEETGRVINVHVNKASEPSAINFMGYHREENCLTFKGEARLFDQFVEFASDLVRTGIEGAFRAPTEIRIPEEGLQSGLTYDEFAARVEVVEYAMWSIPDSDSDEDIDLPEVRSYLASSNRAATPEINYAGTASSEDAYIEDNAHGSDSGLEMVRNKSPSPGSCSSLSPPPEEITMPESLKKYWNEIKPETQVMEEKPPEPERKKRVLRKRRAGH